MFYSSKVSNSTKTIHANNGTRVIDSVCVRYSQKTRIREYSVRVLSPDGGYVEIYTTYRGIVDPIVTYLNFGETTNEIIPEISAQLDDIRKMYWIVRPEISVHGLCGEIRYVPLTQGLSATVNAEMFDWINQWKWNAYRCHNNLVYASRAKSFLNRNRLQMHRDIIQAPGLFLVDHADGNGLDNRLENLRICTNSQNIMNRKSLKNNTSGYKGVNWNCDHKKWLARIMVDGKHIILGWFKTPLEGAIAYNSAAIRYHGEFANLNVLPDLPWSDPPAV